MTTGDACSNNGDYFSTFFLIRMAILEIFTAADTMQACIMLTIDIKAFLWNDICCNVLLNASPRSLQLQSLPPKLVVERGKGWEGGYGDFSNILGGRKKVRATQQH